MSSTPTLLDAVLTAAAETPPAGGGATGEVIFGTLGAALVTAAMLLLVSRHRSGRTQILRRLGAMAERQSGIPGWASLPLAVAGGALLIAVFGMYWDISTHLDSGRDPGPFANASHYFILAGLFGILFAGVLAIAMPEGLPSSTAVKITKDWHAPLGGVLMAACAAFALSGFPLDDSWHRIFGQDVTLWGPTHLLLFGAAGLTTLGAWVLQVEGLRARTESSPPLNRWDLRFSQAALAGGFLIALSTFQGEFDFSVPQFRLIWHPILLMTAASIALVAARVRIGPGGALAAVGFFLVIRGGISLLVGPTFGHTTLHFPLYIVEAIVVELVALRMSRERPVLLGAVAGAAIGTFGLAAEWAWSHVWWVIPWPSSMLPEAAIAGFVTAVAGGAIGGAIAAALAPPGEPVRRTPRLALAGAAVALVAVLAYAAPISEGDPVRAQVTLEEVDGGSQRTVAATVKLDPPDAAEDAHWLTITAWQGGGSVVDPLRKVAPGTYRTTRPIPVHGNWKSSLRLHKGAAVQGLPIFFAADPAIPAEQIPATPSFTRSFVTDEELLQREQKDDVPGFLVAFAYLTTLAVGIGLVASLTWGLARMSRDRAGHAPGGRQTGAASA